MTEVDLGNERYSPDAVEALARAAAHHLAYTDRVLLRIETKLGEHTDQLALIKLERFAWPPLVVALLALVGGLAGELLWRLVLA